MTFRGRVPRDGFLLFVFFATLAAVALRWWATRCMIVPGPIADPLTIEHAPVWRIVAEGLFTLVLLMVAAARLRDTNRHGWWVFALVPLAAATWIAGPGAALASWFALPFWLLLLVVPGTIGPNRFGADPRGWPSRDAYDRQAAMLAAEQASYSKLWN
ncbi:DUF805 domain-containing protein [Sphingomonas sp.]|uniref:DUF805 domain-containing protein n=1 Tax=Sphingomonas sp. TaxID=28214 RepID=UPI001B2EA9DC|nr:DUF805 domain-containing protein [Sphingomonas sp.]MBO9713006.1 DUF805 domain-containing protein [Sphingomonas sp.]